MVLTAGFTCCMDALGLFTEGMVTADRPNTGFIWQPDWISFVVALLAGIAGTLSLTSAKSGALVGVAISVTTVPAAANAAVAFSYQDLRADLGVLGPAPGQPGRHRAGGDPDAAGPESGVEHAAPDGAGRPAGAGRPQVTALPRPVAVATNRPLHGRGDCRIRHSGSGPADDTIPA